MSTLHPHWQATDDGAPVPVRIAPSKTTPTQIPVGTKTVSRRPAAIVGILMAFSIGAVAYGTLDDPQAPLSGELMDVENPMAYFDILAEQMGEQAPMEERVPMEENLNPEPEIPQFLPPEASIVYPEDFAASIPVNPSTYDAPPPAALPIALPINQNTIGANVTESFHSGAPMPIEQPQTGAEMLWATILGAVGILFWQSRGMMKAIAE